MSSRPTKGVLSLYADGDRVDDARRRLLADWVKLVGQRLQPDRRPSADGQSAAYQGGSDDLNRDRPVPSVLAASDEVTAPPPTVVDDLGLPPRMSQVLLGLLAGAAEKQIARELTLSPHTVHAYVKQIYKRLDVSSRGELLARFVTLNR